MKKIFYCMIVVVLLACEDEEVLNISRITDYVIMDPFEDSYDENGQLQVSYDTVYYYFHADNKMSKVLLDYSFIDNQAHLEQRVEVVGEYYAESNHLFMNTLMDEFKKELEITAHNNGN